MDDHDYTDPTRRRLLEAAGTTAVLGLAGCSGDGDGNNSKSPDETESEDTPGGGSGSLRTDTFVGYAPSLGSSDPTNIQWNHLNPTQGFHSPMQSDTLIQRNIETDEMIPYAAEIADISDKSVTLTVRDNWTWHNGEKVTGKDGEALIALNKMTNGSLALFTDSVSSSGQDFTIHLKESISDQIMEWALASPGGLRLDTPWSRYREWIEDWRDASTDKKRDEVVSSLLEATFDEPFGNGPFKVDSVNSRRLRLVKYEDHPDADNINWKYYEHPRHSGNLAGPLGGLEFDGVRNHTVGDEVIQSFPDELQLSRVPALWGQSLAINNDDEDFGRTNVRRALAYIIDRKAVGENYGSTGVGVEAPSGLLGNITSKGEPSEQWKNWLTDSAAEKFNRYRETDKATQLLEEEGYTKEDGKWYTPSGDRFEAPIKVPSDYAAALPIYRTAVSDLREFGIKASLVTLDGSVFWGEHLIAGNYRLALSGWTVGNPLPYFTFDAWYNSWDYFNIPDVVQAPPLDDPNGDPVDVNATDLISQMFTASGEEFDRLVTKLAWVNNYYVPHLPLTEINDLVWWNTSDFEALPSDDKRQQVKWSMWWHPRQGHVKAKKE